MGAGWTTSEEFELMVEFGEAGFLANLVLELVDGAGGIDGLDAPAVGADEVVPMLARDQEGEVGGSFVQAKPADHSLVTETLEKAEDGRFITLLREVAARAELGEGHWPIMSCEAGKYGLERLGST